MITIGFVGLGDMGSGMSKNILKSGFDVKGYDLSEPRLAELEAAGGTRAASCKELGETCDTIFIMVLNGDQVKQVILGDDGILAGAQSGTSIIVSATIKPSEIAELIEPIAAAGLGLLDTPVSGGKPGAEDGQLTIMASGNTDVLEANRDVLDSISKVIFHVGETPGQGQTVKASLQAMIGTVFAGIFESMVLAAKSGVVASIDVNHESVVGYDQRVEAFGSGGTIYADNWHNTSVTHATSSGYTRPLIDYSFPTRYREAYTIELNTFIECVQTETPVPITYQDVRVNHLLACGLEIAAREKRVVPYDEIEAIVVAEGETTKLE